MMTTNANAPVETRHKDEAAKLAGYESWHDAATRWLGSDFTMKSILAHAQTLASGHTPSPCPGCAAKDEAMTAFRREVSETCAEATATGRAYEKAHPNPSRGPEFHAHARAWDKVRALLLPPTDPVVEALWAALCAWESLDDPDYGKRIGSPEGLPAFTAALSELKSRLPLGGAK